MSELFQSFRGCVRAPVGKVQSSPSYFDYKALILRNYFQLLFYYFCIFIAIVVNKAFVNSVERTALFVLAAFDARPFSPGYGVKAALTAAPKYKIHVLGNSHEVFTKRTSN